MFTENKRGTGRCKKFGLAAGGAATTESRGTREGNERVSGAFGWRFDEIR
jgi:hypothetical protein